MSDTIEDFMDPDDWKALADGLQRRSPRELPAELPPFREIHSCGYPEGSFACKIRHIQINTGAAKAAND